MTPRALAALPFLSRRIVPGRGSLLCPTLTNDGAKGRRTRKEGPPQISHFANALPRRRHDSLVLRQIALGGTQKNNSRLAELLTVSLNTEVHFASYFPLILGSLTRIFQSRRVTRNARLDYTRNLDKSEGNVVLLGPRKKLRKEDELQPKLKN